MAKQGNLEAMVSAEQAAELAGLSRQRLWYWERTRLITPTIRREISRRNIVRLYALDALTELLVAAELRKSPGITLQHMRRMLRYFRREYKHPLRELRFAVERGEIFIQHPDGSWVGSRYPVQTVEPQVLSLEPIRQKAREFVRADRSAEDFGRVVRHKRVMGSKPVFKGTRVPVAVVLDFFAAGRSPGDVMRSYPSLTEEDLSKALLLAAVSRRLRAGVAPDEVRQQFPQLTKDEIESALKINVA